MRIHLTGIMLARAAHRQEVSRARGGKSRASACRVSLAHAHVIDEEKETIGRRRRLSRVSSS
jgi:hypothetical protein